MTQSASTEHGLAYIPKEYTTNNQYNMTTVAPDKLLAMQNRIKELEQQNAELVAHCGEQRVFLNAVANFTQETNINEMRFRARELIHVSPKQSLAKIKTDAFREGFEMSAEGYNAEYGADVDSVVNNYLDSELRE